MPTGDNEYELTVVATDEDSHADSVAFTITVTDDNEGVEPTISTRRPPSTYRENDTRTVYTFRASDPQRDPIFLVFDGYRRQRLHHHHGPQWPRSFDIQCSARL